MKHQYKKIYVISNAVLFLCISGVVFSGMSFWNCSEIVDTVTLETVTVYLGGEELHLKDMNLHIERLNCFVAPIGPGGNLPRGRILMPFHRDTLAFYGSRPVTGFLWKIGGIYFATRINDSVALQRLNEAINPIDEYLERSVSRPSPPPIDDTTLARLKKVNAHCADGPRFVEELTLKTATVRIVWNLADATCTDTLVVEDINIPLKRSCNVIISWDCVEWLGVKRTWIIPLPDNAGTIISDDCYTNWHKGNDIYPVSFDGNGSGAWMRLETIVKSFTKSPASCLHRLKQ